MGGVGPQMRELLASSPVAVQLALVPAVGMVVGLLYCLLSKMTLGRPHRLVITLSTGAAGAVVGALLLRNYFVAGVVAVVAVWAFRKFVPAATNRSRLPNKTMEPTR